MKSGLFRRESGQRRVILEELQKLDSHPTAHELYTLLRQKLPKISLGTVYRNLELLSQKGLAKKIVTSGGEARFDGTVEQHCHIRCTTCGRIEDLNITPPQVNTEEASRATSFTLTGHDLEFLGLCPNCRSAPLTH